MRLALLSVIASTALLLGQSPKEVRRIAKQGVNALPQLQRFLLNPDIKVRLEAVRGIVDIGGPKTLDPLIEAARDNEPQVQIAAVNGLVNYYLPGYVRTGLTAPIRKISSDIRSRFSDPDDQVIQPYITVRDDVVRAIGTIARSGTSLDSRANAARAAGILRGKAAIPDLLEALRSKDSDVILETLVAFEKIRDPAACRGVRSLIRDLDERVQSEALQTNGILLCTESREDIRTVLSRTDRDRARRAALSAIAMMPEPRDRTLFSSFLESGDERLRVAAAEGYARLADIQDARKLQEVFQAETRNLPRLALAFALVMDGNLSMSEDSPLRFLVYSLNNHNYRANATVYLTEAGRNPEVQRVLHAALDDASRDEKTGLAKVIAETGDKNSLPALEKLSHDSDSAVAEEGLRQLRNLRARL